MKSRCVVFVLALVLSSVAAFANSNADPRIIIKDPLCTGTCTPVGTHFTFTSPASGTGTLFFSNTSGLNWTSLKLVESAVPFNLISCSSPNAFVHCSVTTTAGVTTIFLSGLAPGFNGIPAGHNFSMSFVTWPKGGVSFTAVAGTSVPEPASIAFFLTGLAGIATRRKLKRS